MIDFFKNLFSSDGFMPHGHCYLWRPGVVWLHVTSDALITLAYYSIPITLFYFVRKRKDLEFHWMFVCFAVFILACGSTHLMEIWNIWHPTYWLAGSIKAVTAFASVPTAVLLMKLVPQALALPSPTALRTVNGELEREIAGRKQAQAALAASRDHLEAEVNERTAELRHINEALRVEIAERKRAEEASQKLQTELAHVTRLTTMGELAASIAHEINQPLGAIVNNSNVGLRVEEIPLLVRYFVNKYAHEMNKRIETVPSEVLGVLRHYHWPGNVRELENFVERTVILSRTTVLIPTLDELQSSNGHTVSGARAATAKAATLEECEREHIMLTLGKTRWVVGGPNGAAARLGLKRTTLIWKMQKLGIDRTANLPEPNFAAAQ